MFAYVYVLFRKFCAPYVYTKWYNSFGDKKQFWSIYRCASVCITYKSIGEVKWCKWGALDEQAFSDRLDLDPTTTMHHALHFCPITYQLLPPACPYN